MKKTLFIASVILIIACSNKVKHDDNKTTKSDVKLSAVDPSISLDECIERLNSKYELEEFLFLAEQFQGNKDSDKTLKWIPLYYASYCLIEASFLETNPETRDKLIDKAQVILDKCLEIDPKESELYTLQGYLFQARLNVSPMFRGSAMSKKAHAEFRKASELNPNNPRPAYLEALGLYYAPKMFGGGKDNAYPLFKKAKEQYDNWSSEILYFPSWGEDNNLSKLKDCESSLNL